MSNLLQPFRTIRPRPLWRRWPWHPRPKWVRLPIVEAALIHAIHDLARTLESHTRELALHRSLSHLATKQDLKETEQKLMSAIQQFADKQNAFNRSMGEAITGISGDIQGLNDKITALQNSTGAITPEDQAILDGLEATGKALVDKLSALDALTPPVIPIPAPEPPFTGGPGDSQPPAA